MDLTLDTYIFSEEALQSPATPETAVGFTLANELLVRLNSLESIYQDVSLEGRISRDQAQFLSENCGLSFGERYPLASFTLESSATNLDIALETLGEGFFATIAAFIKKVVTIIVDILKWILEVLTGYSSRHQNQTRVVENVKAISKANQEVESAMAKLPAPATSSSEKAKFTAYQTASALYDEQWSDFRDQIITQGNFVRFLREFSMYILGFMPQLDARVKAFKGLIESEERPNDAGHMVSIQAQFARLMEPLPTTPLQRIVESAHLGRNLVNPTFYDVALAVNQHFKALVGGKHSAPIYVSECVKVIEANPKVMEPYLVKSMLEKRLIEGLIKEYQAILHLTPKQVYTEELREQYRTVVDQLTSEVKALQLLAVTYNDADLENARLIQVLGMVTFAQNEMLAEKIESYPPESQATLRELIQKGRSFLQRVPR